jgi:hypothetical protein
MNYNQLVRINAPRQYTIDDFKLCNVEEIKELEYDFDFYKREFGDKFDDEVLALFDLIENSDLSKKEVKLMGMMLHQMYQNKYKETVEMFHLKPEDIKPEDLKGTFTKIEEEKEVQNKKEENIEENIESESNHKEEKHIVKQTEFNESNFEGFYDIIKKMEALEVE